MMLDRKTKERRFLKYEQTPRQRSAFEMSVNWEFQFDASLQEIASPKAGDPCPQCQSTKIDYDHLLHLSCPNCRFALVGCFA
jgi:hypothetical protein